MVAQQHRLDYGREGLKWVAIATMTVDHIGLVLYPNIEILRMIGRIAFPLFAYLLVLGMESTHNVRGYLTRLTIFAAISQIPFAMANSIQPWDKFNIFTTLALGLILIYYMDRNSILLVVPLVASVLVPVDYGVYGAATILFFYLLRKDWKLGAILFTGMNVLLIFTDPSVQPFALLALPLILLHNQGKLSFYSRENGRGHPVFRKYFFYVYYPLHLLVLSVIRVIL